MISLALILSPSPLCELQQFVTATCCVSQDFSLLGQKALTGEGGELDLALLQHVHQKISESYADAFGDSQESGKTGLRGLWEDTVAGN